MLFRRFFNKIRKITSSIPGIAVILTTFFIFLGTIGFYLFEPPYTPFLDPNKLLDSFYWTIITITTIGFGDITPSSIPGKMLAIILAFFGVTLVSLAIATIIDSLIESKFFTKRKYLRMVRKMKDIVLICGLNEVIRVLVSQLSSEGIKVVLVDENPIPDDWDDSWGAYIQGDPTDGDTLMKAGVEKASRAVVSLKDDGATLLSVLTIESINPECHSIAVVDNKDNIQHFKRVNCDLVICKEEVIGNFLSVTVQSPIVYS
ncbi:MAG: potassium channel family protein, partial [Candidatus Helarchaeales archaeon]